MIEVEIVVQRKYRTWMVRMYIVHSIKSLVEAYGHLLCLGFSQKEHFSPIFFAKLLAPVFAGRLHRTGPTN
jgi:hypothetical protein